MAVVLSQEQDAARCHARAVRREDPIFPRVQRALQFLEKDPAGYHDFNACVLPYLLATAGTVRGASTARATRFLHAAFTLDIIVSDPDIDKPDARAVLNKCRYDAKLAFPNVDSAAIDRFAEVVWSHVEEQFEEQEQEEENATHGRGN